MLGNLFQSSPSASARVNSAALANTVLWLVVCGCSWPDWVSCDEISRTHVTAPDSYQKTRNSCRHPTRHQSNFNALIMFVCPRESPCGKSHASVCAEPRPPAPYPGVPHVRQRREYKRKKREAGGCLRLLTSIISVVAPRGIEPLLTP
jgi:hypothetical protein